MTYRRFRAALLSGCSMPALQAFWVYALPDRRLHVPQDHEVVALWPGHVRVVPVRPGHVRVVPVRPGHVRVVPVRP